ncbi:hypothetical protein EBZ80_04980 [bacterium]|nr:hypothetical protein [bacterium]
MVNDKDVIMVHHLLVEAGGLRICDKVVAAITRIPEKVMKLLFIHDYMFFYPDNPNILRSDYYDPPSHRLQFFKTFCDAFRKVFFNSKNCFENFARYITLESEKTMILNCVPDIDLFSPARAFPSSGKTVYHIGIMGDINCVPKGANLAKQIISFFHQEQPDRFRFIIFGNFDYRPPNVRVLGKYHNETVLKDIEENQIDLFIFLSEFEETYSLTLSFALRTGLPIVYNRIGAYTERLENYDNCFPFDASDYKKVLSLCEEIVARGAASHQIDTRYRIIQNVPELSPYVHSRVHWDEFTVNLHHRNVIFLHCTNLQDQKGRHIFMEQWDTIRSSGLFEKIDYLFVILLGIHFLLPKHHKLRLIYYSENPLEWEFPSIQKLRDFSAHAPFNTRILYMHTKGVTGKPFSLQWRRFLEYFLIERHADCLKALEDYRAVGTNHYVYRDGINDLRNHFSGNFWWANSDYVKTLSAPEDSGDRYAPEHFIIGSMTDFRYIFSFHRNTLDPYSKPYIESVYRTDIIQRDVLGRIKGAFTKTRPIYGVYFIACIGDYKDIVRSQIVALLESGLYDITDKIFCFVTMVTENWILDELREYPKIQIIISPNNEYERFAINGFRPLIPVTEYFLYYFHTKSVTRKEQCYEDWRVLCDHFTLKRWRVSIELLRYYDCVGILLKNFPMVHFSGNYWWSRSENLQHLKPIEEHYLMPEMFVCSNYKANPVSLHQSGVLHGITEYPASRYETVRDEDIVMNFHVVPEFNFGDEDRLKP